MQCHVLCLEVSKADSARVEQFRGPCDLTSMYRIILRPKTSTWLWRCVRGARWPSIYSSWGRNVNGVRSEPRNAHDSYGPGVSEDELIRIGKQMLQGVAYCHAHSAAWPRWYVVGCRTPAWSATLL